VTPFEAFNFLEGGGESSLSVFLCLTLPDDDDEAALGMLRLKLVRNTTREGSRYFVKHALVSISNLCFKGYVSDERMKTTAA
jgi:hypothetical protein